MIRKPFVRTPYNYDMDIASVDSGLGFDDLSLAVQSSRDEVDINTIVRRFGLTGQLPDNVGMPQYADFEDVYDFHGAMNIVAEAKEAFMRMPAHVRARFGNDPAELVAFVSDERNRDEAVKLGIVDRPAGPAAKPVVQPVEPTRPVEGRSIDFVSESRPFDPSKVVPNLPLHRDGSHG